MLRGASAAAAITGNQAAAIRRIPALATITRVLLENMSVDKLMDSSQVLAAKLMIGRIPATSVGTPWNVCKTVGD
jgi:hypothetical protein